jgi:cytochrome o ubiquinol oxidase subunit 1
MLGKLTLSALPLHEPIAMGASVIMVLGAFVIVGALFYFKKWTWLWKDWITTVDHKKIGVMYIILALIMLLRGFADALMIRGQQAIASGHHLGYLTPHHFATVFTVHGVIMIFFVAMPFMFGLINIVVPLQIGTRDVAFPYLNSLSFWLTVSGALLVNISLIIGHFAATGWVAYPPLSELGYSPGVGVDYYIWALQIAGVGTLLAGINFFFTIIKLRCKGMTWMKMPIFTWTTFSTMILIIIAFPILTVTLGLLFLDRFMGMHFFTAAMGGNQMMYVNLFWAWGHPEVYILILPAFGIFSEIAATFSQKRLFGYATMVWATLVIMVLAFVVWLHHFYTMGASAGVNAFFGITTMLIAVPTGVKIFNWLFTMYQGRIIYKTPMLWMIGFLVVFTIGGMTGVILAIPALDFQLHNSLFLVAHFHSTIIGGVLFGFFAGFVYWFPKVFGVKLNEALGKCAFACWVIGFFVAFMPLYFLGMEGMTRRLDHYPAHTGWQPWLIVAAMGALIIGLGVAFQALQLFLCFLQRKQPKPDMSDPWNARTLEWSTTSPPPFYNFATLPTVDSRDAFWEMKQQKTKPKKPVYRDIHMPKNTGIGFIIAMISFVFGFAMVWHIIWLAGLSALAILACVITRSFTQERGYTVTAAEIGAIEAAGGAS